LRHHPAAAWQRRIKSSQRFIDWARAPQTRTKLERICSRTAGRAPPG
jgi:hypothetical protein